MDKSGPSTGAPALHAVIFDLDGVLVSTDQLHFRAWKALADSLALPFDENTNHHLRGVSREESLRTVYRLAGRPLPASAELAAQCSEKNRHYLNLVSQMTPADILPGASALINALRFLGIKIAVASASKNARVVLEQTQLAPRIHAIVDGNDVPESKPDPRVFLVAAARLNIPPFRCVGVEDAATGIEAIRRAGMPSIGVGPAATSADIHAPSTADLSPKLLFRALRLHQSSDRISV